MALASVEYSVVNSFPPFTFSVKDENGIERYVSNTNNKIFFNAISDGIYKVTIGKGSCLIKSEIRIVTSSVPIPLCQIPILSLVSINDLTATFDIKDITGCLGYELQYSINDTFSSYFSKFIDCQNNTFISFTDFQVYYVRIIKSCNNSTKISNIVSVNLKSNNCYISASCQGIGNDPDYDTFRVGLNKEASNDIEFTLSNSSIIVINKGQLSGQEIINITNGCPYIVSNNLNLKYCGF